MKTNGCKVFDHSAKHERAQNMKGHKTRKSMSMSKQQYKSEDVLELIFLNESLDDDLVVEPSDSENCLNHLHCLFIYLYLVCEDYLHYLFISTQYITLNEPFLHLHCLFLFVFSL